MQDNNSMTIHFRLLTLLSGLLLASCGGGGGGNSTDRAKLRVVHVSPGTENLNLTLDDTTVVSAMKYHDPASYNDVDSGSRAFKVKSAVSSGTFVDTTSTLSKNTRYTYFIYGGGSAVSGVLATDDVSDPSSSKFKLRVINLATG